MKSLLAQLHVSKTRSPGHLSRNGFPLHEIVAQADHLMSGVMNFARVEGFVLKGDTTFKSWDSKSTSSMSCYYHPSPEGSRVLRSF